MEELEKANSWMLPGVIVATPYANAVEGISNWPAERLNVSQHIVVVALLSMHISSDGTDRKDTNVSAIVKRKFISSILKMKRISNTRRVASLSLDGNW